MCQVGARKIKRVMAAFLCSPREGKKGSNRFYRIGSSKPWSIRHNKTPRCLKGTPHRNSVANTSGRLRLGMFCPKK